MGEQCVPGTFHQQDAEEQGSTRHHVTTPSTPTLPLLSLLSRVRRVQHERRPPSTLQPCQGLGGCNMRGDLPPPYGHVEG